MFLFEGNGVWLRPWYGTIPNAKIVECPHYTVNVLFFFLRKDILKVLVVFARKFNMRKRKVLPRTVCLRFAFLFVGIIFPFAFCLLGGKRTSFKTLYHINLSGLFLFLYSCFGFLCGF